MQDNFDMYDYMKHIVQVIKKDGSVIIGYVTDCETDWENDIGDALDIYTGCKHLPCHYPSKFSLEVVFVTDIQSIDILE